jgi:hypothetical protein
MKFASRNLFNGTGVIAKSCSELIYSFYISNLRILALIFSISLSSQVFAQSLFKDQANFTNDVKTLMSYPQAPEATVNAGNGLISVYSSSGEEVKKKLFELSQFMYNKKKYRATPTFTDFYSAVFSAVSKKNMSRIDLDSMLYVTQKAVEKYDNKQLTSYFSTLRTFFEKDAFFISQYNSLYVKGGSFKIRLAEPPPSPPDPYEVKENEKGNEEDTWSDLDNPTLEEEQWSAFEEEEEPAKTEEPILNVGYVLPAQPQISGPVIEITNADLRFESPGETAELKGASGSLMLVTGVFVGKGGTMDWSTAGFGSNELYAELAEYNFPVITTKLYSEGAKLHYPAKTDSIVEGIFEYKIEKVKNIEDKKYPRFKSFYSNVDVKGLGENIEYTGGLTLAGRKTYSSSVDEGSSQIRIKKDGNVVIKSRAPKFELGDSLITANIGTLVIYINEGKDSITHPGISFKYNKKNTSVRAIKHNNFRHAPFIDSYHQLDITVDGIIWDLNSSTIDLTILNGKNQIQAVYESIEYFQADKYSMIQGMYRFHPLQMIIGYSEKNKKIKEFNAIDVANDNKLNVATVKGAMVYLMQLGFIDYNPKSGVIKLRPKARHYVMARRDKSDYDNVILYSLCPSGSNSTLDLKTNELTVRGVDRVFLSDSLKVSIVPDSNTVIFKENRNFSFNGKINTQNFQFVGTEFHFKYDSFLVHLQDIDEIKVAVDEQKGKTKGKGKEEEKKTRVLGNELRYSSGTLYINKPENKSSRKKYPEYPIFDATTGATVFFDKKHINGGAYDTTLQFKIPPFRVDSLSGDDPHAIGFDGEFVSGGIFPPFKEKLVVMPDYSLGFEHKVPKDGYQLYENKGKFYSKIKLDNQGLRGDGEIRYLTTTAWSNDFVFYKDSVITIGTKVDTKAGKHPETNTPDVTFPDMQVGEYVLRWLPHQDSMNISNTNKGHLSLYKGTATLEGKSIITKDGMRGVGVLFTRGSEARSSNFHFEETRYSGRNTMFQVLTENPTKPALLCNDVKLEFDLKKGEAYFSPEVEGYASNVFPYLQYKSSLDKGVWDLEKKKIYMKMPEGGNIEKSYFYSTHPLQDSLVFFAEEGVYDMKSQTLNINGVPYIKSADSKIFPDSNKVVIHENAVMETLVNAKLVIDTIYGYHNLYDGKIDIKGRKKFDGEATYQYVNLGDDTLSIRFQDFRLQESLKKKGRASTVATAVVKDEDSLYIDDGILYKGKVTMYADNKILFFDGYVSLDLKGALHYSQWMKYINNGDQNQVIVDVKDPKADNGKPLYSGLHYCLNDSIRFYTTFLSLKKTTNDLDIFTAKGILLHDHHTGNYLITPQEKKENKTLVGNTFAYNDSSSVALTSGEYFFTKADENFSLRTVGNGTADLKTSEYTFNTLQTFTCKAASSVLGVVGKNLKTSVSIMPADTTAPSQEDYERFQADQKIMYEKIAQIAGDKSTESYKSKSAAGYVPFANISGDFSKAIVLSEVNFKWSHEFNAWYSVGKIKVANFLKEDINKTMNGYVEIRKTLKGDLINIYLEPAQGVWYFFSYENNRLSIVTSSNEVNAAVAKKTKGEMPTREKFFFVSGQAMEKSSFVRYFEENYLSKKFEMEFEQHEQKKIDVPDAEIEKEKEESDNSSEKEKKNPYPYEEKKEYEKKEGKKIEEPELNREKKEQSVEEKKELQKDRQKMKSLIGN